MGYSETLAILLALGDAPLAQEPAAAPAPNPVAQPEANAPALAERPEKPDPAVVDAFLRSRSRTLILSDCKGKGPSDCSVTAFIPEPDAEDCHYTALVTDRIVATAGEPAYVHLTRFVVKATKRKPLSLRSEDVAVTAAVMFAESGFHPVCFRRGGKDEDLVYSLYLAPDVDVDGEPVFGKDPTDEHNRVSAAILGSVLGGIIGGMKPANGVLNGAILGAATGKTADRMPYFQRPFRSFSETVGCTITGCPEKLALSVTVRGGGEPLPILQGSRPTDYRTNATLMVPRSQLSTLAVQYPDGTVQKVAACNKLSETRVSASFLCQKAK